jgi:hypothetical protein
MKQITIVAPRQDGLVAKITEVLGKAGINILELDASDVKDLDMVVLTVDQYDETLRHLRDAGFDAVTEDASVVKIPDKPGSLAKLTQRLYEGGVRISSVRILQRQSGIGIIAISMDQPDKGLTLIKDLILS